MTDSKIVPFVFDGEHLFRTIERSGASWYVAVDACRLCGVRNVSDTVDKLEEDEKGIAEIDTLGGKQSLLIISEAGLYTVMLRCHDAMKPGTRAYRFRRWVTSELLPTIRKTGRYASGRAEPIKDETQLPFPERRLIAEAILRTAGPRAALEKMIELGFKSTPTIDRMLSQKEFNFAPEPGTDGPIESTEVH